MYYDVNIFKSETWICLRKSFKKILYLGFSLRFAFFSKMDTASKAPLSSIEEDELHDMFATDAPTTKVGARKTTKKSGLSASLSRQSLASRGKSRMRLPSDRGGNTEENLGGLKLMLKKTESITQQETHRPLTSEKSKLPPIGHKYVVGDQDLSISGVHDDSSTVHRVRPSSQRGGPHLVFDQDKCSFVVTVDPDDAALSTDIAELLKIHSLGIPIEISFYPSDYRKGTTPGVRGVFHCSHCLAHWQRTGVLRPSCHKPADLTRGPMIEMNTSDAAKFLQSLKYKKKFLSNEELEKILPLLGKAKSDEERRRILKSLYEKTDHESNEDGGGKENKNSKTSEQKKKRSKQLTARVCQSMRQRIFNSGKTDKTSTRETNVERESDSAQSGQSQLQNNINGSVAARDDGQGLISSLDTHSTVQNQESAEQYNRDVDNTIKSVGLKNKDGSFYPGFFSKVEKEISDGDNADGGTPFLAEGRIDDDGCYHELSERELKEQNLPTLEEIARKQEHTASESTNQEESTTSRHENTSVDVSERFKLAFQDGPELNLKEAMGSGIWHTQQGNEYYLPGVFNEDGQFMASSAITIDGHVVPGARNTKGMFVPFGSYDENGDFIEQDPDPDLSPELLEVARKMKRSTVCPDADRIDANEWKCVKEGVTVEDPRQITVYSTPGQDETSQDADDEYSVFVGGEIGPDGNFYPYGRYDEAGNFIPGSEPISHTGKVKQLSDTQRDTDNSDDFLSNLGIQIREKTDVEISHPANNDQKGNVEAFKRTSSVIEATKSDMDHKERSTEREFSENGSSLQESKSTGSVGKGRKLKTRGSERSNSRQLNTSSSRSLRSQNSSRIYNRNSGELCRTPSVAFIQEKSLEELDKTTSALKRPPSAASKNKEALNPLVKNRTGKPNTRAGSLAENLIGTPGDSETSQLIAGSQTAFLREQTTRPQVSDPTKSKDAIGTRTSSYGNNPLTDRNKVSRSSMDKTRSVETVTRRVSQLSTSDRKNIITPDRRRSSQLNMDGPKMNTPATVARQREIEKKTRKEKAEVKAKYQNAAHHSALSSGGAEQDQASLLNLQLRENYATRNATTHF
uniref:uncharacterized protein LOC113475292 n=1 Tax=Ciona intestinalis TaxID=7719 RepID=UPI000EF49624|nr:uncharacterized protein LOC113475292 [Ciona intestinalis]|eukprot:XP_026695110.1 uncharacterized protein LOC113475292 [Ciona intestinalis]